MTTIIKVAASYDILGISYVNYESKVFVNDTDRVSYSRTLKQNTVIFPVREDYTSSFIEPRVLRNDIFVWGYDIFDLIFYGSKNSTSALKLVKFVQPIQGYIGFLFDPNDIQNI